MFTWEMAYTIPRPGCWISVTHLSHRRTDEINNSLGQPFKQRKEDVTRNYRGVSKQAWLMAAACGTVSGHHYISRKKKKKSLTDRVTRSWHSWHNGSSPAYMYTSQSAGWRWTCVHVETLEHNLLGRRENDIEERGESLLPKSEPKPKPTRLATADFVCVCLYGCVCVFFRRFLPHPICPVCCLLWRHLGQFN